MADASGSYVGQLDSTFPDGDTDAVNVVDDAIKKTRSVLVASFPSVTGAVTKTHTEINALTSQDEAPRLIHKVSAAVAAGAVIQEVTLTAGCDYKIIGSGLKGASSINNSRVAVQVGDGSGFETGTDYAWLESGYSTSSIGSKDTAVDAMRTMNFNNDHNGLSFESTLAISAADANSTSMTTTGAGQTLGRGFYVITTASFCHNSAKTTLTRFRVLNDGAAAISTGTIFIWKLPQTVPA